MFFGADAVKCSKAAQATPEPEKREPGPERKKNRKGCAGHNREEGGQKKKGEKEGGSRKKQKAHARESRAQAKENQAEKQPNEQKPEAKKRRAKLVLTIVEKNSTFSRALVPAWQKLVALGPLPNLSTPIVRFSPSR